MYKWLWDNGSITVVQRLFNGACHKFLYDFFHNFVPFFSSHIHEIKSSIFPQKEQRKGKKVDKC